MEDAGVADLANILSAVLKRKGCQGKQQTPAPL